MPKQSRGFFICDFCGLTFDGYDEASYHEVEECQRRGRQAAHAEASREVYAAGPPIMPPLAVPENRPPAGYEFERPPVQFRRLPLMGLQEASQLTEADARSCQNIEIFEADDPNIRDEEGNQPFRGQVGLRCMNCVDNPPPGSCVFPQSLGSIGDGVRILADRHLSRCGALPAALAHQFEHAAIQRQQDKEEGGPSAHEEESNRRMLVDHSANRCQQMGIVEKFPEDSGIVFRDSGMGLGGKPAASIPASRYPPGGGGAFPSGYMRGPGGNEPMPPASLARRQDVSPPVGPAGPRPAAQYDTPYAQGMPFGQEGMESQPPRGSSRNNPEGTQMSGHETDTSSLKTQQMTFEMPSNFPFFQDPGGDWMCKFCSHVHPQYRDPQYIWSTPAGAPPPGNFIEHHLNMCRAYHQSMNQQLSPNEYQESLPFGYPQPQMAPQMASQMAPQMAYGSPQQQPNWDRTPDQRGPPMGQRQVMNPGNFLMTPGEHPASPYDPFVARPRPPNIRERIPPQSAGPPRIEGRASQAVEFLATNDKSLFDSDGRAFSADEILVIEEDKLLLTDYFFWLMKQLRMVRFSESDRKTRGGKREKILVGYGGLQCVHCAEVPNSRKFFWSNVDRLANSFAEIPAHVLKCRRCPQPVKDALHQVKQQHPEQMARLPRGSQKVFFRRMWRRLHDGDPKPTVEVGETNKASRPSETKPAKAGQAPFEALPTNKDSPGTIGSEESILLLERPTKEAAKALADAAIQHGPPSPSSRILLAIPEDKEWLSDTDCFVRRQLEVFCATKEDVETARLDRKYPVFEGQIGIRCVHCALSKGAKGAAVAYPFSISGIYESVREFQRLHLDGCGNLPSSVRSKLAGLKGASSLSSVLRKYYVLAARALGLKDTRDGIRPGAESIPLGSQAAFAFSDEGLKVSEEMERMKTEGTTQEEGSEASPYPASVHTPTGDRKRRQAEEPPGGTDSKKPATQFPNVRNEGV
jgi:hypothetical protein